MFTAEQQFEPTREFLSAVILDDEGLLFDKTTFEAQVTGLAFNNEQQRFLTGVSSEFNKGKNFVETTKRSGSVLATKMGNAIPGTFSAATFSDLKFQSRMLPAIVTSLIESYKLSYNETVDATDILRALASETPNALISIMSIAEKRIYNIAQNYKQINTTDGVSIITPKEFIARLKGWGRQQEYQDIITKLENDEEFTFDDRTKLIQMQKNFY